MERLRLCAMLAAVCLVAPLPAMAQTSLTPDQLIDGLTSINCPIPGASGTGTFGGFLADEKSLSPSSTLLIEQQGKLRIPAACENADVQNIVHLGPKILPALIHHLDDTRPTGLVVGQDFVDRRPPMGGQFFADEYDARHETWPLISCYADTFCENAKPFDKPYTVKVGDICFLLIGQIVNRHLNAVRYQPTAIVMVNSPIESPALAKRVRADWEGVDSDGVKSSLLADLDVTKLEGASDVERAAGAIEHIHVGALERLRYYFPDDYASLTGADLELREAFERNERERNQKQP